MLPCYKKGKSNTIGKNVFIFQHGKKNNGFKQKRKLKIIIMNKIKKIKAKKYIAWNKWYNKY